MVAFTLKEPGGKKILRFTHMPEVNWIMIRRIIAISDKSNARLTFDFCISEE